ncbi:S-layer homology domain-containing protein [Paenibacillus sp. MER TA 81-3]|uniref:S-layer homology domain-containing protein n=1 Tax=Paenibacillus sp. MER TA 81-3 TaxID=2939573 RepID=UPI00203E1BB9|nr:S-layer homology domain-containing protein [Paenibacillus sp. MER TA 81-3]MCM3338769.1 S-layer homology domain-containing protein [Paenibacillus sp. MER TA 81-3]
MKLQKKIVVSTVAASLALGTLTGLPLSSKGLQEALGVNVAYAAVNSVDDAIGVAARRLGAINDQLQGKGSAGPIKGAEEVSNVQQKLAVLKGEKATHIIDNVWEGKLDKYGVDKEDALDLFISLAQVAYGNAEELQRFSSKGDLLQVLKSIDKDLSFEDVKGFADAAFGTALNKENLLTIIDEFEKNGLDSVMTMLKSQIQGFIDNNTNNRVAKLFKDSNVSFTDLENVKKNMAEAIGDSYQPATNAIIVAAARNELALAEANGERINLAFKLKTNHPKAVEISNYLSTATAKTKINKHIKWKLEDESKLVINENNVVAAKADVSPGTYTTNVIATVYGTRLNEQVVLKELVTVVKPDTGGPVNPGIPGGGGGGGGGTAGGTSGGGGTVTSADKVLPDFSKAIDEFKKSSLELSARFAQALEKISTLDVSSLVKMENGKAVLQLSDEQVKKNVEAVKKAYDQLVAEAKLIDSGFKAPNLQLTLNVGNTEKDAVDIKLSKYLFETIAANEITSINILANGASIAVPSNWMKADAVLTIVKEQASVASNVTPLPLVSDVYTFKVTVDGKEVGNFDKKVTIKLPLVKSDGLEQELFTMAQIEQGKFTAISGKVVNKAFEKMQASLSTYVVVENKVQFNDINSVRAWAGRQIEVIASKGIIEGKGDGKYDPKADVTRAEFAKMIVKSLELENRSAAQNFKDVTQQSWASQYIAAASEQGIIKGVGNGNFNPNAKITRAEMSAMIARAMQSTKQVNSADDAVLNTFTDAASIPSSLKADVAVAVKEGIVIGSDGKFNPQGKATRAEAAVMIYRLMK